MNLTKRIAIFVLLTGVALFSFGQKISPSQIQYWVGSGSNEAILIVNWGYHNVGLAWGYRFNGTITAHDMLAAIDFADDRLSINMTSSYVNDIIYSDAPYGSMDFTSISYDFPMYNVNDVLASSGINGQPIVNGDVMEWGGYYSGGGNYGNMVWTNPVYSVTDPNARITPSQIQYWVGSGSNESIVIMNFCTANVGLAWGYRYNGTLTAGQLFAAIDAADSRLSISGPPSGLAQYSYNDGTNNYSETFFAPWYTVNQLIADVVPNQYIVNGDIVEVGNDPCANVSSDWTSLTFSTNVISVSDPNQSQPTYYNIYAYSGNNGSISPVGDSATTEGSSITYTFTADAGYHLESVLVGNNDITSNVSNNTYTISNITHADTIYASFASDDNPPSTYYTIHAKSGDEWATEPYGTISPFGDSIVEAGSNVTYTFTPNTGYHLGSVMLGNNEMIGSITNNTYTVSNISHDDTIWARFAVDKNNTITANDILYWAGSGSNEVIFAVNWCNPQISYAWGYRFNGDSVCVADVMQAIKNTDTRFDYNVEGGFVNQITYTDNTDTLSFDGYLAYNVNEETASIIASQYVHNNDIIEFGGTDCSLTDDFWNSVWTISITPVSIPDNSLNDITDNVAIYTYKANGENFVSISGVEGIVAMSIFDINGKPLQRETLFVNSTTTKRISTNDYPKGMYFIQLKVNDKIYIKKLIIC